MIIISGHFTKCLGCRFPQQILMGCGVLCSTWSRSYSAFSHRHSLSRQICQRTHSEQGIILKLNPSLLFSRCSAFFSSLGNCDEIKHFCGDQSEYSHTLVLEQKFQNLRIDPPNLIKMRINLTRTLGRLCL